MNLVKTAMLLAGLTAVFLVAGYLLGGASGALIALVFAAGTNAYALWNSDKMALRMHNARVVTQMSHPSEGLVGSPKWYLPKMPVLYPSFCSSSGKVARPDNACQPCGHSSIFRSSIQECTPCCEGMRPVSVDARQAEQKEFAQKALLN